MPNFSIRSTGILVTAQASNATAGNATALPAASAIGAAVGNDLMVYNPDTTRTAYVRAGTSNQVTAGDGVNALVGTPCMPVPPGAMGFWDVGDATHLAAYCASGSISLVVFRGAGN